QRLPFTKLRSYPISGICQSHSRGVMNHVPTMGLETMHETTDDLQDNSIAIHGRCQSGWEEMYIVTTVQLHHLMVYLLISPMTVEHFKPIHFQSRVVTWQTAAFGSMYM